jgi:acyl carrier protein
MTSDSAAPPATTLDTLRDILVANFPVQPDAVTRDARLDALDIDSLSVVEVLFEVEDRFGITIPSDSGSQRNTLKTIGDLTDFVDSLIVAQKVSAA